MLLINSYIFAIKLIPNAGS